MYQRKKNLNFKKNKTVAYHFEGDMQPFFYTISRECRVTALEEPCSSGRCPISALLLPASSLNRRDKSIEEIRGRSANHFELCFGLH